MHSALIPLFTVLGSMSLAIKFNTAHIMVGATIATVPVLGDLFPYFYYDSGFWFIFFVLIFYSAKRFISAVFPQVVKNIPDVQSRTDYFNYYLSLCHHSVVVPLAIYRLLTIGGSEAISSFMISGGENYTDQTKDFYHCESSAYMTGYLLADLCTYAIPMAFKGDFLYLGHHIMALGVSALVPFLTTEVAVYCSRIMLLEMSSIFFALRFVYVTSGFDNALVIKALEVAFAISFFFARVINLSFLVPQVYFGLVADDNSSASEIRLGWFIISIFIPLWALQVWWFTKIIEAAFSQPPAGKNEKLKNENQKKVI